MADITDIKAILYTEKTIELQESGVIVVQTSPRMTKNSLKDVFKVFWCYSIKSKFFKTKW